MRYDCIILNPGAITAGNAVSGTGNITPKGARFRVTEVEGEVPFILDFTAAGESIAPQGNGMYVGSPGGTAGGPARRYVGGYYVTGRSYSYTVSALESAFTANNGRVAIHGVWED